ncbi:MAG TPA: diacylglycerol kinase family protein, partial [Candidatus Deferrimicrobiaceae bacterium]|nr:diacylglycerol kinase family protein [Candidatus Deferrimicrobiaceae bacterium]
GCSAKSLGPFQTGEKIEWSIGLPSATDQADVILLFGGDGTIHHHLARLVQLRLPVLIVPAGSGNDFARALGIRNLRGSIAAWRSFCARTGKVHWVDLGTIVALKANAAEGITSNEPPQYFCSVAGVGLDAEVAAHANALPRWLRARGGYALTLIPTIFRFAAFPMRILELDEDGRWTIRREQPTLLAAFANTPAYGGGMRIAPQARMDDGQLDVCVIRGIGPFKLASMFPTVYFGRHLRIRGVDYFQAPRLRVETETPREIYADGEYVCRTPVEIGIQRAALRVLTP